MTREDIENYKGFQLDVSEKEAVLLFPNYNVGVARRNTLPANICISAS